MRIADALRIEPGDVVTLVGGGGKTTVMFRLAEELLAAGLTVISTMTTKIFVEQMTRAPASRLLDERGAVPPGLAALLKQHRHVLLGGRIGSDWEKLEGVPAGLVDQLAGEGVADVIIVEGDGSRRLPLKAPAEHEPVVPASTTVLVPLAGLDILGQPLDAEHVHRPQLISGLTGLVPGGVITPDVVSWVLAHPQGGAKGLPERGRLAPLLNKADLALAGGRQIARQLVLAPWVDEVVVAAAATAEPVRECWGRVAAVVLAAGEGRRFRVGHHAAVLKQMLPWRGKPLVGHVVEQASACPDIHQVFVTTGSHGEQVHATVEHYGPRVTPVPVADWSHGQSRSVSAGLQAAQAWARDRLSAVLFLLADQPGVTPALLTALVERHRQTHAPVVAPRYQGQRGTPVLFDRRTFLEFAALEGDAGARGIIQNHEREIAWLDWPTDEILKDIDTPEDYAAAHGQL